MKKLINRTSDDIFGFRVGIVYNHIRFNMFNAICMKTRIGLSNKTWSRMREEFFNKKIFDKVYKSLDKM